MLHSLVLKQLEDAINNYVQTCDVPAASCIDFSFKSASKRARSESSRRICLSTFLKNNGYKCLLLSKVQSSTVERVIILQNRLNVFEPPKPLFFIQCILFICILMTVPITKIVTYFHFKSTSSSQSKKTVEFDSILLSAKTY